MSPVTIKVKRNGPYSISLEDAASVIIVDHEGRTLTPEPGRPIVLCRCGASATKPFCDKSHRTREPIDGPRAASVPPDAGATA